MPFLHQFSTDTLSVLEIETPQDDFISYSIIIAFLLYVSFLDGPVTARKTRCVTVALSLAETSFLVVLFYKCICREERHWAEQLSLAVDLFVSA